MHVCVRACMYVCVYFVQHTSSEEEGQVLLDRCKTLAGAGGQAAYSEVLASLLLCFTISFDEFLLAFFLAGEEATLPVYIWSQLRFPNRLPSVLALGSCILLASCVLVLLAEWVRRLGAQPSKGGQEA